MNMTDSSDWSGEILVVDMNILEIKMSGNSVSTRSKSGSKILEREQGCI